jgi:Zn-dependent peptidase ImmA (M78 family)
MILPHRKTRINKLAEDIAYEFSNKNLTLIHEIAKFEDVPIHYDNYENAFDGMLLYDTDSSDFHIHINIDNGNRKDSKRGRFTLAHELGHLFLDEHRLGLKYGLLEPHGSFHNINQKTLIEEEADYFASSLLMPTIKFRNHSSEYKKRTGNRKFSFDTIKDLSDSFSQRTKSGTFARHTKPTHKSQPCKRACLVPTHRQHSAVDTDPHCR